jgi:hypothetical protein
MLLIVVLLLVGCSLMKQSPFPPLLRSPWLCAVNDSVEFEVWGPASADGSLVSYRMYFGDWTYSDWSEFVAADDTIRFGKRYTNRGEYPICAMARNGTGLGSATGSTIVVLESLAVSAGREDPGDAELRRNTGEWTE